MSCRKRPLELPAGADERAAPGPHQDRGLRHHLDHQSSAGLTGPNLPRFGLKGHIVEDGHKSRANKSNVQKPPHFGKLLLFPLSQDEDPGRVVLVLTPWGIKMCLA